MKIIKSIIFNSDKSSWYRRGYTHGYGSGVGYTGVWLLLIDDIAEGLEPCLY